MFPNNSKANELFVIQIVCLSSCWILALMRFWVKLRTQTRAEDVLIAFALHGITQGGIGKSILEISPTEVITAFKVWYACELIYGPLAAVIRTSIAFLILRVCRDHWVRVTLFACLGIIYTFTVVYFFINLLQCFPPSYYWTQFSDPTALGYCAKPHLVPNVAIAHSLLMAFTDWVIGILLPIIVLWNVQMTKRNKIRAGILLGLGAIAGAGMIIRIPYIRVVELTTDFLSKTV
ncbi:hypothetical protein HIM_11889 [Hirsutella minnesotensis 3608]|uniref:Rhodopsin domain-containing protein n=1 Tax=Hirsutella minnesotensis 3608 TaxID=1043627 RepID=A0A0F7ZQZ5_9HYPO|nr:hypothetical protein HIM_11889 [Hirsutella minnesotensis 3608]